MTLKASILSDMGEKSTIEIYVLGLRKAFIFSVTVKMLVSFKTTRLRSLLICSQSHRKCRLSHGNSLVIFCYNFWYILPFGRMRTFFMSHILNDFQFNWKLMKIDWISVRNIIKNVPILQVRGSSPAPPTPPPFRGFRMKTYLFPTKEISIW